MGNPLVKRLKELGKEGEELYLKLCKVSAIDTAKRIMDCEPLDGSATILDVRLTASATEDTADTDYYCLYPRMGSIVGVGFLDSNEAILCLVSEIDKVEIRMGKSTLTIDANNYHLNTDKIELKSDNDMILRAAMFDMANNDGISVKSIINRFIDEVKKIVVVTGVSPNIGKLEEIKQDNNKLFK